MPDYRQQLDNEGWFLVKGVLNADERDHAFQLSHICAFPATLAELPNVHPVSVPELADHPNLYHYDWIDHITFRDPILWQLVAAHPR